MHLIFVHVDKTVPHDLALKLSFGCLWMHILNFCRQFAICIESDNKKTFFRLTLPSVYRITEIVLPENNYVGVKKNVLLGG